MVISDRISLKNSKNDKEYDIANYDEDVLSQPMKTKHIRQIFDIDIDKMK